MRILMASDLFHPYVLGGGERQMYEVAKRLARRAGDESSRQKLRALTVTLSTIDKTIF
jgi:hypothetical protein